MKTGKRGRSVDWTGHIFGDLTVVKRLGWTDAYGKSAGTGAQLSQWELKCICGNTIIRTSSNLRSFFNKAEAIKRGEGNPLWRLNCNNHPSHVMPCKIGERLGDLEVISFPENTNQQIGWSTSERTYRDRWFIGCLCHGCGQYTKEAPYLLVMHQWQVRQKRLTQNPNAPCGCGCMRSVKHGMSRKQEDGRQEEYEYTLWSAAKQRAKKQGVPFDLEPSYLKEIGIPEKCPVLGIPLNKSPGDGTGERNDNSPSLDKFIPSLGYVPGNVHIISWRANRMKSDGTPDEWIKIAEWCQKEEVRRRLKGDA